MTKRTPLQFRNLILGGGTTAGFAARPLAEAGEGPNTAIVTAETQPPMHRPPLSKSALKGETSTRPDDIGVNPLDFYREHDIHVHLGTEVTDVDLNGRRMWTPSHEIAFDKLLIATGCRVRTLDVPGERLRHIHYLRTPMQSDEIRADAETREATRAVVVGGGFIAMETAAVLAQDDLKVTMVFPEDHVWSRLFTHEMAAYFERAYAERGVHFLPKRKVTAFGGNERVHSVHLDNGEQIPANLVLIGAGVEPAVELFHDSPLTISDGIEVDEYLRTGVPKVWAAGDVANYPDRIFGRRRRVEHWDNAKAQGEHVGRAMLGEEAPFEHVPYFFSDVFDMSYEYWGDHSGAKQTIYRGDVRHDAAGFSAWWLDDTGRLLAAFVMNRPDEERELAPQLIRDRATLPATELGDESTPLDRLAA